MDGEIMRTRSLIIVLVTAALVFLGNGRAANKRKLRRAKRTLEQIKLVDGPGSGLDADTLQGMSPGELLQPEGGGGEGDDVTYVTIFDGTLPKGPDYFDGTRVVSTQGYRSVSFLGTVGNVNQNIDVRCFFGQESWSWIKSNRYAEPERSIPLAYFFPGGVVGSALGNYSGDLGVRPPDGNVRGEWPVLGNYLGCIIGWPQPIPDVTVKLVARLAK
jgi:hypothetical protein